MTKKMKKKYIIPTFEVIEAELDKSFCTASIDNGGEKTPGKDIPDWTDEDGELNVGAKGGSSNTNFDDDWE